MCIELYYVSYVPLLLQVMTAALQQQQQQLLQAQAAVNLPEGGREAGGDLHLFQKQDE